MVRPSTCRPVSLIPLARDSARQTSEAVPWNVAMVRANEIWGRTTGDGIKVGIMDTGIYRYHPDLTVHGGG